MSSPSPKQGEDSPGCFQVFIVALVYESDKRENFFFVYSDPDKALEKAKIFSFVDGPIEAHSFTEKCGQVVGSDQEEVMATMLQKDSGVLRFFKTHFTPWREGCKYATVHVHASWGTCPPNLFLELTAGLEENDAVRSRKKVYTGPRNNHFPIDVFIDGCVDYA